MTDRHLIAVETLAFEVTEAICERMEQDGRLSRKDLADALDVEERFVVRPLSADEEMDLGTLAESA